MSFPQKQPIYSYSDYKTWPSAERWEIIDGLAFMQAAPSRLHQEVLMEISRQLSNYLAGSPCRVYPAPFCVRLPERGKPADKEIPTVVEPDVSVVCDRSKLDDEGCIGAPDLIVEIVSPSSARRDRVDKFNKYEKAGVREYWLIEPELKLVTVFLLQPDGRFGRPENHTEADTVKCGIFPGLSVDLGSVFSKLEQ